MGSSVLALESRGIVPTRFGGNRVTMGTMASGAVCSTLVVLLAGLAGRCLATGVHRHERRLRQSRAGVENAERPVEEWQGPYDVDRDE